MRRTLLGTGLRFKETALAGLLVLAQGGCAIDVNIDQLGDLSGSIVIGGMPGHNSLITYSEAQEGVAARCEDINANGGYICDGVFTLDARSLPTIRVVHVSEYDRICDEDQYCRACERDDRCQIDAEVSAGVDGTYRVANLVPGNYWAIAHWNQNTSLSGRMVFDILSCTDEDGVPTDPPSGGLVLALITAAAAV